MRKSISVFGVLALGLLTASCGSNGTQRSATGALTGIGAGAVIGGPIGAVAGGAVGAAGGAAMPEGADTMAGQALNKEHQTTRSALNSAGLAPAGSTAGSGSSAPPAAQKVSMNEAKDAQRVLQQQGLYHGRIDGIVGSQTKHAVSTFQQREGLQQTAMLDQPTVAKLNSMPGANAAPNSSANNNHAAANTNAASEAAENPSAVRQRLSEAGYTNISNVRHQANNTWTADAQRNGETLAVRVDATTGKVTQEQHAASSAATPSSGSSQPKADPSNGTAPPPSSPSAPPANGSNAPGSSGSAPQTPNH